MAARPSGYVRRLNVFDATMLVIGGIVGAGIFLNPAVVAQRVGTPVLTVGAWALGGAVALAGAFVFAELGARKPEAGGGYVYLRDALGPLVGFLYGWTELLVINSGGIAAVAVTFASYAAALLRLSAGAIAPLAVGAIIVLSLINYFGIRPGSVVQNVLTVLKIVALVVVISAGLLLTPDVAPQGIGGGGGPAPARGAWGTVAVIGAALIPVLFAYGGWQSTNFVAGEIREPRRTLPRALVMGVIGVVTLYVLANLAYVEVLGVAGLAPSTAPASDLMRAVLGPAGATFIALGIAVSTFGFLNLAILSAPRMYQTMAADGLLFRGAARLSERYHAPAIALAIQGGWAILLVSTKTYGQLLDYVVFGDWIFFGLVGITLWIYRRADVGEPGGFRLRGFPVVPGFFVAAAAFTVASTVWSNPLNALLGAAIVSSGVPVYLWFKRRRVPS